MSDRSVAIRKASTLSQRNDVVIYVVQNCEDEKFYAVSEAILEERFLPAEIQAECYPDGYVYDNNDQERH